jgi:DNA-binding transcriptional LysR family regulator
MQVFVAVAQQAGFAAAGRELDMSTAAVSKHVSALEAHVGTRLFDRTTRRVGLTEAGRLYLERCLECLQTFDDADAAVGELAKEPKGTLRITAPLDFRDNLAPVLADMAAAYPEIVIDLRLTNRVVDLVDEGVDVGIRIAPALDGRYVARPLARTRLVMFGSPAYLRRNGRPQRPEDLRTHRTLVFCEPRPMTELVFVRAGRRVPVPLRVAMMSNDGSALKGAVVQGMGLGAFPSFMIRGELEAGKVEPVLLDWELPAYQVSAIYPHRRFVAPKVRVFVEALRASFGDGSRDPWWLDHPAARTGQARRASARARLRVVGSSNG